MSTLFPQMFVTRSLLSNNVASKLCQRGFKYQKMTITDDEFRMLVIPGHSQMPMEEKRQRRERLPVPPPRSKSMPVDQDWTNAWPTAKSVTWSTLPLPVRMGYVEPSENKGIIPSAYGNAELMKIPNFLHLTPNHIKKHCAAIKKFCTPWPKELASNNDCTRHFPVTITTRDYVFDGPSLKDERARVVTLKINLSSLNLDYHARDKLIRLANKAYDQSTDQLVLQTDKCPMKKQNYDYLVYLLTALYKESCKTEPWEAEKTLEDMEKYFWDMNKSKKNILELMKKLKSASKKTRNVSVKSIENLSEDPSEDDILALKEVNAYKDSVEKLFNEPANKQNIEEYRDVVKKLLNYA